MNFSEIIDIMLNRLRITAQLLELAEQKHEDCEGNARSGRAQEEGAEYDSDHVDDGLNKGRPTEVGPSCPISPGGKLIGRQR